MPEQLDISSAGVEIAPLLAQAAGVTLHWDDWNGVCGEANPHLLPSDRRQPSFQAKGPPITGQRDRPYWPTPQISRVPALPRQTYVKFLNVSKDREVACSH